MKKLFTFILAAATATAINAQIVQEGPLQQAQNFATVAQTDMLAPYTMFQAASSNAFTRKALRYRIKGMSAGELGSITDTALVKFSGNRESSGLQNKPYTVYQVGYPYESDQFDHLRTFMNFGSFYKPHSTYTKKYDVQGRVTEAIDSILGQQNRYTYAYNSNGKIETIIAEVNYGSGWQNTTKEEYLYNPGLLSIKLYSWGGSAWNFTRANEIYGDIEHPDTVIDQNSKTYFTYDAAKNVLTQTVHNNTGGSYVPTYRITFTYNSGNKAVTQLNEVYQQGSWSTNSSVKITYTAGGDYDSIIGYDWASSAPVNNSLVTYSYQNGLLSSFTNWQWDGAQFKTLNKFNFILDANKNLAQVHYFHSVNGNLTFVRRYRYYYETYNSTLGINEVENATSTVVYPNPAAHIITFATNGIGDEETTLHIYDVSGRLLFEKTITPHNGEATTTLSVEDFAPKNGLYLYKLTWRNGESNGRLIVEN